MSLMMMISNIQIKRSDLRNPFKGSKHFKLSQSTVKSGMPLLLIIKALPIDFI